MPQRLDETELRGLLDTIYERFHYDFRDYNPVSVQRRLGQALSPLGCSSLAALEERITRDGSAFQTLLRYLTVQVSDLFRGPQYWRVLRERVVPVLRTYPSLNIWIAGCSSGEELYSFAILLREEGLLDRTTLYATDINADALVVAQAGTYASDRLAAFTANHRASGGTGPLAAHYEPRYGSVVFDPSLRKSVVFSDHSLATDSVFAEVQLVSCRNVLIYFEQALRDRALSLFRDSLCLRGFLGLGLKETLRFSLHEHAFDSFAPEERWYRRR